MTIRSALGADQPGNRTDRSVGANATRQAIADYDWPSSDVVVSRGRWHVFTHPALDYMSVWVDVEATNVAISADTWETLSYEEMAIAAFFKDMVGGATGMRFIVADAGPYAVAARKQALAQGTVISEDPVQALITAINNLVLQAASMNRQPTALQQGIFAERYARLRSDLGAIEGQLDRARSALDLAGTVLYDATRGAER